MKKKRNRFLIRNKWKKTKNILIICLMIFICVFFFASNYRMNERLKLCKKQEAAAQKLLEKEKERAEEIKEFQDYTETDAYVESLAREKLSLVYPDEIVFKVDE